MIKRLIICDRCNYEQNDREAGEGKREFFNVSLEVKLAETMYHQSYSKSSIKPHIPPQMYCERCCLEMRIVEPIADREPVAPEQYVKRLDEQIIEILKAFVQENSPAGQ